MKVADVFQNRDGLSRQSRLRYDTPALHGFSLSGSLSILHKGSGLNLTLSGGMLERDAMEDSINLYAKIGWIARLSSVGNTAFGVDFTRSENLPSSRDKAWSLGAAVSQSFPRFATEVYVQYRLYGLDRKSGAPVGNLNIGSVGARVKF